MEAKIRHNIALRIVICAGVALAGLALLAMPASSGGRATVVSAPRMTGLVPYRSQTVISIEAKVIGARSNADPSSQAPINLGYEFGYSVAISKNTMVVGAPDVLSGRGAVYVFTYRRSEWRSSAKLSDPDPQNASDFFGYSVAISGDTVVVGAPDQAYLKGAIYIFAHSDKGWHLRQRIDAPKPVLGVNRGFGRSLAIFGTTLAVGAPNTSSNAGTIYTFSYVRGAWRQRAHLYDPAHSAGDDFGYSLAISPTYLVVSAPGTEYLPSAAYSAGAAYVYSWSGHRWHSQTRLLAPGPLAGDNFGLSAAIFGGTIMIGAPNRSDSRGATYVFAGGATSWHLQSKLVDPGGAPGDNFGGTLALSSSTAAIGASYARDQQGIVYVFARHGTTWLQRAWLVDPGATSGDFLGFTVAVSRTEIVSSAIGAGDGAGAVYIFSPGAGLKRLSIVRQNV